MGKGQRHSKNAGVMGSEGLTYWEKKQLGYGTVKERLGKDSQGNFDDCCLTLQTAVDPVLCPSGFIFSREAILENLLSQKKLIKRKLAAWQSQQDQEEQKELEKQDISKRAKLEAFDRQNNLGASDKASKHMQEVLESEAQALGKQACTKTVQNIHENEERMKEMKAFWLPSMAPDALNKAEKPAEDTLCPASGKRLRLKDLIPLKFTEVRKDGDAAEHSGGGRQEWMDPISYEGLTNNSVLVCLKATGDVMLKSTYEKFVKPEGNYNGHKIKEKDVISIQKGGTGFTAHDGDKTTSRKHWALGPGNGLTDLRGQHRGPTSHSGLFFWN